MDQPMYVKPTLKEERIKQKLTYDDMAKALGYRSKSTYMYIEKGQTVPTLPIMISISQLLQKPITYFFNLEVQGTQTKPTGTEGR
jgi:DNA-binding XRE family transcriptional regulator